MKQRYIYRVVTIQGRAGKGFDIAYRRPHHSVLAAEQEAMLVSRQPQLRDAFVAVEEHHQTKEGERKAGWQSDTNYLPVRVSQWQRGRSVFGSKRASVSRSRPTVPVRA